MTPTAEIDAIARLHYANQTERTNERGTIALNPISQQSRAIYRAIRHCSSGLSAAQPSRRHSKHSEEAQMSGMPGYSSLGLTITQDDNVDVIRLPLPCCCRHCSYVPWLSLGPPIIRTPCSPNPYFLVSAVNFDLKPLFLTEHSFFNITTVELVVIVVVVVFVPQSGKPTTMSATTSFCGTHGWPTISKTT